jgi:BirA family biotin operon repressor/biotin-[acetyl-CoA-carboxylase] ligase
MLDEEILAVLRKEQDSYVSGEDLCRMAGISRAAIWKHMEKLREEGYEIEASPHLGYRLKAIPDRLIPSEVRHSLKTRIFGRQILSYARIDSTNDAAYSLAEKGLKEGSVILADEQVMGKGRHGRRWVSPPRCGIYMSCILRPDMAPDEIPKITLLAAVAVARAIRSVTGLDAMIKWPNDILVNGKKVCGILTEMKAEQDSVNFIILGIGINASTPARSLPRGAASLRQELRASGHRDDLSRIELTRRVLEELDQYYGVLKRNGFRPIVEEWKALSAMMGARIRVLLPNRTFDGLAHDIDPDGGLVVRLDSGVLHKVSSGDIVMVR